MLHAMADALLGAAGSATSGGCFPADQRTPRGIASADLLDEVVGAWRGGWRPASST